jgi:poly(3-hydroxybutyrate) depolymerase
MPRYFFNVYKDLPEKRAHGRMLLIVASLAFSSLAQADDNQGLRRGGDPHQVSISGLSSGGAMALQYAVAHSGSIIGVGSVAGPAWYCAEGDLAHAMQVCMKGQGTVRPKTDLARQFAAAGKIDSLSGNTTSALKHSFVFQSKEDEVLNPRSGQANVDFLAALTGVAPKVDQGRSDDGSANAGHGIISPDGTDSCSGKGKTFIRRCGAEDNPAEVLSTMYGEEMPDPSTRKEVADADVWEFDQQPMIDAVKNEGVSVSGDYVFWYQSSQSTQRQNFDLAPKGYIYVPTVCEQGRPPCRVHVALHGCAQDPKLFAQKSGYNDWAEHYRAIIVYPAIKAREPWPWDYLSGAEPNPLGCWDWWGYLDPGTGGDRYLTKDGPQIRVIERIIAEVTKPLP